MDRGSIWYQFSAWFCRNLVFWPLGGLTVKGVENVPEKAPLLVAPIHLSHFDPPLVGSTSPRHLRFMAKKELFKFPLGPLILSLGAFPVSRGEGDSAAVRRTLAELADGQAVLVFPEGTRGDGEYLGKIQLGLAMLAKKSGAYIIPVGINGVHKMLPKGQTIPKRAKLTVVFGKPFTYDEIATSDNERTNREAFVNELQTRLIAACHEAGLPIKPPH